MTPSFDLQSALAGFGGHAPLFPLPSVTLLPHMLLPLHIFEQRYRKLTSDVLESHKIIAMSVLQPGWEPHYDSKNADIHPTVCLGKVASAKQLSSGKFNLIVQGLVRARVIDESASDKPYRIGRLEVCEDYYPVSPLVEYEERRRDLLLNFRNLFPNVELGHIFHQAIDTDVPLGPLCDILAASLQLSPEQSLAMLQEVDVEARSNIILNAIISRLDFESDDVLDDFPPAFSLN
ncbi:MAG: LON peptidase substrate-binding domain-containing protein [Planctomycetota bacterium]|nr:LON peptidase substrate-binding domain-containing protein [Planctomycetota bacterium]